MPTRTQKLIEAADSRRIVGTQVSLRADMFRAPELIEVLLGEVAAEKHPVDGHAMEKRVDVRKPERVADYSQFKATEPERVPSSYYLPAVLSVALERLSAHGGRMTALAAPETIQVEEFQIAWSEAAEREFQGHEERRQLPAGTLRVDMTQPLARLAFYLLEPRSDDGLVDWSLLDEAIGNSKVFPIVRSKN